MKWNMGWYLLIAWLPNEKNSNNVSSRAKMCLTAEVNVRMNDCSLKGCRLALWSIILFFLICLNQAHLHDGDVGANFFLLSPLPPHPTLKASSIVRNLDFVSTSFGLHHIKGFYKREKSILDWLRGGRKTLAINLIWICTVSKPISIAGLSFMWSMY